jgi:hypothetical protein
MKCAAHKMYCDAGADRSMIAPDTIRPIIPLRPDVDDRLCHGGGLNRRG